MRGQAVLELVEFLYADGDGGGNRPCDGQCAQPFKRKLSMLAFGCCKYTKAKPYPRYCHQSAMACWVNWALGWLVWREFPRREMPLRVKGVDYRLLIALLTAVFLFWHGGIKSGFNTGFLLPVVKILRP